MYSSISSILESLSPSNICQITISFLSQTKLIVKLKEIHADLGSRMKSQKRKAKQTQYRKMINEYTGISASNIIEQVKIFCLYFAPFCNRFTSSIVVTYIVFNKLFVHIFSIIILLESKLYYVDCTCIQLILEYSNGLMKKIGEYNS